MSPPETPPAQARLWASIEDLREDSIKWIEFAKRAETARSEILRNTLTTPQVSRTGADIEGLHDSLQKKYSNLLTSAVENLQNIASVLRIAANQYEDEERRTIHAILKNW